MPDCGKQSGFFVPWRISWYNGGMSETLEGRKTGGTDGEVSAAGGRGGKGGTRGGNRGGCREDKARQLRLMKLLEQVQRGGYPNATDLRNKFEVSRSTIMRDIDFLKDQYLVPIEYCSERGGYCISDPNYTIPSFLLTEGELCVTDIAEKVDLSQSAISHQLKSLKQMHLIRFRREGKNILYSLADDHVKTILQMGLEHAQCEYRKAA